MTFKFYVTSCIYPFYPLFLLKPHEPLIWRGDGNVHRCRSFSTYLGGTCSKRAPEPAAPVVTGDSDSRCVVHPRHQVPQHGV